MECREVRLKLDEYIKGRLDNAVMEEIKLHMEECCRCSEEHAVMVELNDLLKIDDTGNPNPNFSGAVMDMIQREQNRTRSLLKKSPVLNLGVSMLITGIFIFCINTTSLGATLNMYVNTLKDGAAAINNNLSITVNNLQSYFTNIFGTGGENK